MFLHVPANRVREAGRLILWLPHVRMRGGVAESVPFFREDCRASVDAVGSHHGACNGICAEV